MIRFQEVDKLLDMQVNYNALVEHEMFGKPDLYTSNTYEILRTVIFSSRRI